MCRKNGLGCVVGSCSRQLGKDEYFRFFIRADEKPMENTTAAHFERDNRSRRRLQCSFVCFEIGIHGMRVGEEQGGAE